MSCLVTLPMSAPQCNLLTVLTVLTVVTVPCGFLACDNNHLHMYHKDCSISSRGKIPMAETVGMPPWSMVLRLQRVVSVASVTSAGKLAT